MPLYEYECTKCKHRFERIQKFSDPPAESCPQCGAPVAQVISAPAVQFKGSGWYVTDYARKSSGGATGKKDAPADSGGGDKAGESKPKTESKTESKKSE